MTSRDLVNNVMAQARQVTNGVQSYHRPAPPPSTPPQSVRPAPVEPIQRYATTDLAARTTTRDLVNNAMSQARNVTYGVSTRPPTKSAPRHPVDTSRTSSSVTRRHASTLLFDPCHPVAVAAYCNGCWAIPPSPAKAIACAACAMCFGNAVLGNPTFQQHMELIRTVLVIQITRILEGQKRVWKALEELGEPPWTRIPGDY